MSRPWDPPTYDPEPLDLTDTIHQALEHLDARIAGEHERTVLTRDPAMTRTLDRSRDLLRRLLRYSSEANAEPHWLDAVARLVERIANPSATRSREEVWDLAEELEATQLWLMPDDDLIARLQLERGGRLPNEAVEPLLAKSTNPTPTWRRRAIALLSRAHDERVSRIRDDEARDLQWSRSMAAIGALLVLLLAAALPLWLVAPEIAVLPAGALGATLSGAYRLREHQRTQAVEGRRFARFLLLQPAVGATVAFAVGLAATAGLIGDGAPSSLPLLGFFAGFLEPFVLRTFDRLITLRAGGP